MINADHSIIPGFNSGLTHVVKQFAQQTVHFHIPCLQFHGKREDV